jgi:hypothetical protein
LHQRDLAEVASLGQVSSPRSPWQTETAKLFSDTPLAAIQAGVRDLIGRRGLDISSAARLLAVVDVTMADAGIAIWDAKYAYGFWRPVTELAGSGWTPLIVTPPYPEYPAGTPAMFASISHSIPAVLGDGLVDITITSVAAGISRHYDVPTELARDAVDGRVWGGVHYRTSDEVGADIGRSVADWVTTHDFLPTGRG